MDEEDLGKVILERLKLALGLVSGRIDRGDLTTEQYEVLGFGVGHSHRDAPGREEVLKQAEAIILRLEFPADTNLRRQVEELEAKLDDLANKFDGHLFPERH